MQFWQYAGIVKMTQARCGDIQNDVRMWYV